MSKQYIIRLAILAVVAAVVFSFILGSFNLPLVALVVGVVVLGGMLVARARDRVNH